MSRPKSISGILAAEKTLSVLELSRLWPEIVGRPAAEHSRPAAFRPGLLTVAADSAVWANELSLLKQDILARIAERLGPGMITDLKFKSVARPKKPGRAGPAAGKIPPPDQAERIDPAGLDPDLVAAIEAEAADIADPDLRATFIRVRLRTAASRRGKATAG